MKNLIFSNKGRINPFSILFLLCFLFLLLFVFNPEIKADCLSVFIDLKPLYLSLNAGGPGIGLGYEIYLKNYFSIYGKLVYMNFYDAGIWLLYYQQGLKFYFNKTEFDKFFIGLYGIILYGVIDNIESLSYGVQFDAGYKWRLDNAEKFYIEPSIGYIYIFGESPLPGISLGLAVGMIF